MKKSKREKTKRGRRQARQEAAKQQSMEVNFQEFVEGMPEEIRGEVEETLIKLLTRLYDPSEGQILLDGVDLREYDIASLHQRFGVIFQDFVRYQFTVQENIGFGQVDALGDMQRIQYAADRGGAIPVIENLPKGYDTILGRRWE